MDACTLVRYMYAGRMHAYRSRALLGLDQIGRIGCSHVAYCGGSGFAWQLACGSMFGRIFGRCLALACPRIGTRPRTCMGIAPTLALMIVIALHWHCICIGTHVCACICIVGRTGHCLMPHWHCICVHHLVADVCNCVFTWVAIALAMEAIAVL